MNTDEREPGYVPSVDWVEWRADLERRAELQRRRAVVAVFAVISAALLALMMILPAALKPSPAPSPTPSQQVAPWSNAPWLTGPTCGVVPLKNCSDQLPTK